LKIVRFATLNTVDFVARGRLLEERLARASARWDTRTAAYREQATRGMLGLPDPEEWPH